MWACRFVDVSIVNASVQLAKDGKIIGADPSRRDRSGALGAFA